MLTKKQLKTPTKCSDPSCGWVGTFGETLGLVNNYHIHGCPKCRLALVDPSTLETVIRVYMWDPRTNSSLQTAVGSIREAQKVIKDSGVFYPNWSLRCETIVTLPEPSLVLASED